MSRHAQMSRHAPMSRLAQMSRLAPMRRYAGTRRLVLAVLLGLAVVPALPAAPASAHAALVRTSPAQGTVVSEAPNEVVITFSEHVVPVKDKIRVVGPDGKRVDKNEPRVTGNDLRIPVRTDVPRGTFLVSYRVISADSHPVGAGYTYSFGAASATAPQPTDSAGRTDRAVAILVSSAHYVGYVGLILLAGPALILAALWPPRLSRRGPTRLAYLGIGLIAASTIVELYLQAPYESGGSLLDGTGLGDVLTSQYGTAHLVRLGVLAAGAVLLRPYLDGRTDPPRTKTAPPPMRGAVLVRIALALLAAVGAATWPLSGHPAASNAPTLTIIADTAHLASMAIWLGGLVMLVGFVLRQANARELGVILPVWSNWAALAVAVLVLAGTAQALIEIVTVGALLRTTYGHLVLLKIGILALVVGVAFFSRQMVLDRVVVTADGISEPGVRRLRRSVLAEVAGAVLILGLTSALVQTTPARTAVAAVPASPNRGIFATTLNSKLFQLQLDVEPTRLGNNEVHLYAYAPDGAPIAVQEWKASAALPAQGIEGIDIPLLALTDSHATGSVTLPNRGNWQFSFTLRTSAIDEATVTTTITIT
jgi:copper transport protein